MPPVKRRYILFRLDFFNTTTAAASAKVTKKSTITIHEGDLIHSVRDIVQKLYGDYGVGSILFNFHAKKYDPITRTGVFSMKRDSLRFIKTSLPLIRQIKSYSVRFQIIKISGTIRGTLRSLQGYHGQMIHKYKRMLMKSNVQKQQKHSKQQQQQQNRTTNEEYEQGYESIVKSLIEN